MIYIARCLDEFKRQLTEDCHSLEQTGCVELLLESWTVYEMATGLHAARDYLQVSMSESATLLASIHLCGCSAFITWTLVTACRTECPCSKASRLTDRGAEREIARDIIEKLCYTSGKEKTCELPDGDITSLHTLICRTHFFFFLRAARSLRTSQTSSCVSHTRMAQVSVKRCCHTSPSRLLPSHD